MHIEGYRRRILLAAASIAVVLVIIAIWPSGPRYQGRSVKKWFYNPSANDPEAFRAMGRSAVPFLIDRLEDAPSERVKSMLETISPMPREVYRQRKQMWQNRAAYLLGEMGTAAQPAMSHLTNAATDAHWGLRGSATVALLKLRGDSIEPLIEKLRDTSDSSAWYENAMMVGQFGARAESAVPILLEALQHKDNIIQAHAIIALGMIGRQPEKCIPALVPFLTSPSVSDRQKAMGTLLRFGTNSLPAKREIEGALKDSDPWVRNRAQAALKVLEEIEDAKR